MYFNIVINTRFYAICDLFFVGRVEMGNGNWGTYGRWDGGTCGRGFVKWGYNGRRRGPHGCPGLTTGAINDVPVFFTFGNPFGFGTRNVILTGL